MAKLDPKKVVNIALDEVGYCEKATNASLDGKIANAGYNNYTKYSRDLVDAIGSPYAQGVYWCDNFVDWCFIKAYGVERAAKMLGGWSAYCPTSAQFFKNKGRYYRTKPKVGDQIFFLDSLNELGHTGIVYKVSKTYVYTVEGNTSSTSGVVPNGGEVCKKKYALSSSKIDGYGRPDWSATGKSEVTNAHHFTGTYPLIPPNLYKGSSGKQVKNLQLYLNWFGGYGLAVDGEFGKYTDSAVRDFQKRTGLIVDGEFGPKSLAMAKVISK